MANEFLFLNYLRSSGYINTGLVKIRKSDGSMYYYDNGWRPACIDKFDLVLRWMGTVPTFANLPTSNKQGDVWTVLDQNSSEYAWDGNKWNFLGRATAGEDLTWNHTKSYKSGEISYFNSQIYFSLTNNNQGNDPETTLGTSWKRYYPSEATTATLGLARIATDAEVKNGDDVPAFVKPSQIKLQGSSLRKLDQASAIDCVSGTWYLAPESGIAIADSTASGQIETSKDGVTPFYSQEGEKATLFIDGKLYYRFDYTAGTFKFIPFV